jgi:hypothetical protein
MGLFQGRETGRNCCHGENTEKCIHMSKLDGVTDLGVERLVLCYLSKDFPKCKFLMTGSGEIAYYRCPVHMKVYALKDGK